MISNDKGTIANFSTETVKNKHSRQTPFKGKEILEEKNVELGYLP
jgi:hypothetical protein